jgi:SPP1 family predicted phage head-tail adaptor
MTARVPIGEIKTRLTLEAPSRSGDGGGGADVTWVKVATVWAAVRPVGGGEGFTLDRVAGRASHEIYLRHRADVRLEMRLRDGARIYDIRSAVDPDGRRQWLRCLVEERDL